MLGVWTIVSSVVFTGSVLGWLVFADGLALAAVALVALTAHEFQKRVVHTLVVAPNEELQAA